MHKSFTLLCTLVCAAVFAAVSLQPVTAEAQKNKNSKAAAKSGKTSDAKKDQKASRDSAKKDKKTDRETAKSRAGDKDKNAKTDKKSAKEDARRGKKGDRDEDDDRTAGRDKNSKDKNSKDKRNKLSAADRAEMRREEAERRRVAAIEAARQAAIRQAAIEAARRREQARREAVARQRAFENGLRTETQSNIAADSTAGEDLQVRQAAINALGSRAGSVVVMDAQNGQIITMVNQKWAMGQGYKPCSTIKLVTGTAGMNEGVINQSGNVGYKPQRLDLTDALAVSNNGYFQNVGGAVGFPKMMTYAREYGLGMPTGINAPGESAGRIPDFKTGFAVNHMSSHGDDFEVTPLQLATMVSAIANGGKLLTPQIARTPTEAAALRAKVRHEVNISKSTMQSLLPGMMGAVNYGTARRANDPSLNIGGKTGSCIGQGSWLGLFASVAPVVSPKYSVVVVTRGNAERGKWAAAVAGQVYQALAPKIRALTPFIAASPQTIAPRPKIDASTATALSDEDNDAAETDDAPSNAVPKPAPLPLVNDKSRLVKPIVMMRPVGQPNNAATTPNTQKGGYVSRPNSISPDITPSPTSSTPPNGKSRPRIVPQ